MRRMLRLLLTVVMDLLLVVAAVLLARILIAFFGHLSSATLARRFLDLTRPLAHSFGLGHIVTPYRGVFDFNEGAMLGVVLVAEWVAAFLRRFVR
jgi:hypothetical protein